MIKTFESFTKREMFDVKVRDMKHTPSSMHQLGLKPEDLSKDDDKNLENYMFFGNLETMKRHIEDLLRMDRKKVDMVLRDGHNWAIDHIVSSKDDIEEVFNFLRNETAEEMEDNIDE